MTTGNNPVDVRPGVTGNFAINNFNSGQKAGSNTFWCGNGTWKLPFGAVVTVVNLAGLSPSAGFRATVTDSNVAASGNFGAIVAGGGSNTVPVFYDGTNWRIG